MNIEKWHTEGREATLYLVDNTDRPLVVLNAFTGNGASVSAALAELSAPDHNLLVVGNLKWDHDMTPWYCPPLSANDTPCTGGADEYLRLLTDDILPKAKALVKGTPSFTGIAGYSLAGLFAVYAMYQTDAFDRAASMSGSLWFPGIKEYCMSHEMKRKPDKLYLSLGNKEAKTRNKLLTTVQDNTEAFAAYYRELGIDVTYELNPGNHFKDAELRSARGIKAILED